MIRRSPRTSATPTGPPAGRGNAAAVLAALLDGSLALIGECAADARRFDGEAVTRAADVWDNNTSPLLRALTAVTRGARERRSLAALAWMAGLGAERRAWMAERAAAAGYSLDGLLPPAAPSMPRRDYLGHVIAPVTPLTARGAESLAADYDLASAEVSLLRVERSGAGLAGQLDLAVARGYPADGDLAYRTAMLGIRLRGLTEVRFDSASARGVTLRAGDGGVTVALGSGGVLRAATAEVRPRDPCWHLSSAGRRADAVTPPRDDGYELPAPPKEGRLGAHATAAGALLHGAMTEMRAVRSIRIAHRVPLLTLHRAFAGAGEAILAAGARRPARRREAAFAALIREWAVRGGPELAEWFAAVLDDGYGVSIRLPEPREPREPREACEAAPPGGAPPRAGSWPAESELLMASHTVDQDGGGASARVLLAVPPSPGDPDGTGWRLRAVKGDDPARFRLRTGAFAGAGRPRVTVDERGERHFVVGDGDLDVTRREPM